MQLLKLISNLLCDCHDLSLDKSYGKGNGQFLSYWMKTKISEGHVYWKYTRNCSFKKLQFNILIQILSLGPPFFSPFFIFQVKDKDIGFFFLFTIEYFFHNKRLRHFVITPPPRIIIYLYQVYSIKIRFNLFFLL